MKWKENKSTVNVLLFQTLLFLFSNKILVIRAGIHKKLDRIANREDQDQTASEEAVLSGSALFLGYKWQATTVPNFKNLYRIYAQQTVSSTCVLWGRGWGQGETKKGAVLLGNTSTTATIQNESQFVSIKYVPCVGWSKPISNKEAVLFCLLCPGVGECECDLWLAREQVLPAMSTSLARLKDFLLLTLCISIICKKQKSHTSNRGQNSN